MVTSQLVSICWLYNRVLLSQLFFSLLFVIPVISNCVFRNSFFYSVCDAVMYSAVLTGSEDLSVWVSPGSLLTCLASVFRSSFLFFSIYGVVMSSAILTESKDLSVRVSPGSILTCFASLLIYKHCHPLSFTGFRQQFRTCQATGILIPFFHMIFSSVSCILFPLLQIGSVLQ